MRELPSTSSSAMLRSPSRARESLDDPSVGRSKQQGFFVLKAKLPDRLDRVGYTRIETDDPALPAIDFAIEPIEGKEETVTKRRVKAIVGTPERVEIRMIEQLEIISRPGCCQTGSTRAVRPDRRRRCRLCEPRARMGEVEPSAKASREVVCTPGRTTSASVTVRRAGAKDHVDDEVRIERSS